MGFSKYNKGRPFLLINRYLTPADGEKTEAKDWQKDGKWNVKETIHVVDRVTDKHISESAVIIDILQRSVIRNQLKDNNKTIIDRYMKRYNKEIAESITIWIKKLTTKNKKQAEILIQELQDELGDVGVEVANGQKTDTD